MLTLYTILLGSFPFISPPDTAARPPVHQQVKLGLHAFSPADLTLSYERQFSDGRWSVSGGVGYYGQTSRSNTIFHDYDDTFIEDWYTMQDRFYSLDLQVRRYIRPRASRPLGGWYLAANLHTFLRASQERHTLYTAQNYNASGVLSQLELNLGRQWLLGRRITLDTYAGLALGQQRLIKLHSTIWPRGYIAGFGVQVGYRLRPLPPR
ncbi:DUF3575 domain-containing protein [Hymenobacter norwichensis]|uniref:DUF3575 domain-containing protein n=1 Tax=Hymenobacter norwichensis TaxID=223903 RepID=UPI0003B567E0|nr:DUF3575 domain-containing protein [Hymenobacter norwichensis]